MPDNRLEANAPHRSTDKYSSIIHCMPSSYDIHPVIDLQEINRLFNRKHHVSSYHAKNYSTITFNQK
jgi:hypothetical protein